jgi:hypothetical protein
MAQEGRHGYQRPEHGIHVPHQWEFADAAARLAAIGFQTADLYKLALQLDDMTLWILSSISPITWTQIGGADSSVRRGTYSVVDVGLQTIPISPPVINAGYHIAVPYIVSEIDGQPYITLCVPVLATRQVNQFEVWAPITGDIQWAIM